MSQQPEALRLANNLMSGKLGYESTLIPSAAELRRLHAENEALKAAVSEAVAAEREACAKSCESSVNWFGDGTPWASGYVQGVLDVADGIRARGAT